MRWTAEPLAAAKSSNHRGNSLRQCLPLLHLCNSIPLSVCSTFVDASSSLKLVIGLNLLVSDQISQHKEQGFNRVRGTHFKIGWQYLLIYSKRTAYSISLRSHSHLPGTFNLVPFRPDSFEKKNCPANLFLKQFLLNSPVQFQVADYSKTFALDINDNLPDLSWRKQR